MDILKTYKKLNLVAFSVGLALKKDGKKDIEPPKGYNDFIKYDDKNINKNKNGFAIRMGTKLKNNKYVVAVDIDDKSDDKKLNGLIKWNEMLTSNGFPSETAINTPIQKTMNNGYHYLFQVSKEQIETIGTNKLGLMIDGKKYSIDIIASNGFLMVQPSSLKTKSYKWIKSPSGTDILDMPTFVYDMILDHIGRKVTKTTICSSIKYETKPQEQYEDENTHTNDEVLQLFHIISNDRYHDYDDWIKLGTCMKFLKVPFSYFDMKSKTSSKYEESECLKKWNSFKCKLYDYMPTLRYYAKKDNAEKYSVIINSMNTNKLLINDNYETLRIDRKYLLDVDQNLDDEYDVLISNINRFIEDEEIKTLNIKSSYGSGKTQLLKKILDKTEYKRILWLSYRITYTDDMLNTFKEYDFGSYLKNQYSHDRLIVQLESLNHLDNDDIFVDEDGDFCSVIPAYDLVICDEIESLLNQFSSTMTFKGKNNEAYDFLFNIIKGSKKVISLDGDLNNRSLSYLSNFGQMLTVVNDYNKCDRVFQFVNDEAKFNTSLMTAIETALENKKKVGICSMSKNKAIAVSYNDYLLEHFPNIKILLIHGDSSDIVKAELKDINNTILNYDVFIYSPTVEAGVNIDLDDTFSNLFCILSASSCSQRSFLQMTGRIRKLTDNNITILNTCFKDNKTTNFWTYEEVEHALKYVKNMTTDKSYKTINEKLVLVQKLSAYDKNYIFNKLEKLNANQYYFLPLLKILCEQKGIKMIFDEPKPKKKKEEETNTTTQNITFERIVDAEIIDDIEYEKLLTKQNKRLATDDDKYKIKKFAMSKSLGVDNINIDILKAYTNKTNTIHNYMSLIDRANIKKHPIYLMMKMLNALISLIV